MSAEQYFEVTVTNPNELAELHDLFSNEYEPPVHVFKDGLTENIAFVDRDGQSVGNFSILGWQGQLKKAQGTSCAVSPRLHQSIQQIVNRRQVQK